MAELPDREAMEFDVVIVGAGPAGLSAAIRLKQLAPDCSVVVVEKGSEVGAHILSGAVIDPVGIDRLLPDWRKEESPIKTAVSDDRFYMLTQTGSLRLPNFMMPPLMSNHGNFIVSLGNVCRWLASKAEALGVEIYPGFAAAEVLYGANGDVTGIATGDDGFIRTDVQLNDDDLGPAWATLKRRPLPFETNIPGVFAVGDVHSGSMKRVAAATGEGASAIASVHRAISALV